MAVGVGGWYSEGVGVSIHTLYDDFFLLDDGVIWIRDSVDTTDTADSGLLRPNPEPPRKIAYKNY